MTENEMEIGVDDVGIVDTTPDESSVGVYEIGYHLLPTLSEEEVQKTVSGLMETVKAKDATFVGDRFPSKIQLAYPITKRINTKPTRYDSGYFGWMAFEVAKDAILEIKTGLESHPSILRYIILSTSRDEVAAALSGAVAPVPTGSIEKPKRGAEGSGALSETALEEALQTIATEDAKVAE